LNIAFVTYRGLNAIAPDDALLAEVLRERGHQVEGVVWDDPAADWSHYDAIVIRSCWDYQYTPEKFVAWLDHLDAPNLRVFNPIPIVRWNHDKRYLRDLERHGIAIAPTYWCERNTTPNLHEILKSRNWQKAVVKPTISGTSMLTWTVSLEDRDTHDAQLADLLTKRDMMIQQFVPEILEGEWSLAFFGRQFSHAAIKRPAPGDFRVQDEHGGTWSQQPAPPELVAQARHVLDCVNSDLLYARVDGIQRNRQFILMELEIIEPMLYIGQNRTAAELFANEFLKRLSS
jgi:glutathione synthase/RimK-type ligase-like ATP-grasp enzyme